MILLTFAYVPYATASPIWTKLSIVVLVILNKSLEYRTEQFIIKFVSPYLTSGLTLNKEENCVFVNL